MSSAMYAILCALMSLAIIWTADYAYRFAKVRWGRSASLAQKAAERDHVATAQPMVSHRPAADSGTATATATATATTGVAIPVGAQTDDGLEEYAKSLLK
jgi:hypothetical protein